VFDFDSDGQAEVVYSDECYARVYRGSDGTVLFSYPAVSGTGYELPVIADVDGDFASEIVVARAPGGIVCPAMDPLHPTTRTESRPGFVVFRDPRDRWSASRPIWNQHAYAVTGVTDDGRIPRTRDVGRNWEAAGLNNFRANVQGSPRTAAVADLTVTLARPAELCGVTSMMVPLHANVCNRGTNPVGDGAIVRFSLTDSDAGVDAGAGVTLCDARTPRVLAPGDCTEVTCTATIRDPSRVRNILVVVDPDHTIADCHEGNNRGALLAVYCPG